MSRVRKTFLVLITTVDVSRAHFYADAVRDVCVRLPDEDPKAKEVQILGRCSTVRRTFCTGLGEWRLFPRRGVSVPLFPQRLANLHPGAR